MRKDVQAVKTNHSFAAFQDGGGIVALVTVQHPQELLVVVAVPIALRSILFFISIEVDDFRQEALATLHPVHCNMGDCAGAFNGSCCCALLFLAR